MSVDGIECLDHGFGTGQFQASTLDELACDVVNGIGLKVGHLGFHLDDDLTGFCDEFLSVHDSDPFDCESAVDSGYPPATPKVDLGPNPSHTRGW